MSRKTCIYGTPLSEIEGLAPDETVFLMIDMEKAFVEPKAALSIMGAKYTKHGVTGVLAPGSTGVNSVEEPDGLIRLDEETVIIKPRWSAFFKTGLDDMLQKLGTKNVVLAGTTTPNCVRTTCYDSIAYNYRTLVLARCTSSQTDEIQRANLEDMRRAGAEIV